MLIRVVETSSPGICIFFSPPHRNEQCYCTTLFGIQRCSASLIFCNTPPNLYPHSLRWLWIVELDSQYVAWLMTGLEISHPPPTPGRKQVWASRHCRQRERALIAIYSPRQTTKNLAQVEVALVLKRPKECLHWQTEDRGDLDEHCNCTRQATHLLYAPKDHARIPTMGRMSQHPQWYVRNMESASAFYVPFDETKWNKRFDEEIKSWTHEIN